jgi:CRP-like cAMP-binding protein
MDVPMLRGAGVQALADLAAASQAVSFAQGDFLERPGAEREHLIYVVDGEVRAERADPPVVRHYGPGDLVGGAASLGGVLAWEARAVTATQALAIPIEGLFDLMEEHFDLVRSAITAFGAERELLLDRLAATSGSVVLS